MWQATRYNHTAIHSYSFSNMAPKTEPKIYVGIGLDFETGGLNPQNCACTQIAVQAVRLDTWQVIDQYQAYIYPYNKQSVGLAAKKVLRTRHEIIRDENTSMEYEKKALEYSAITMDILRQQGVDIVDVAKEIIAFTKRNTISSGKQCKPILIGQNIQFDIGFLQQMMNYAGLMEEFEKTFAGTKDYYGNFQPHYIDTIHIGRLAFGADHNITSYKLEMIASQLGVELDDAHDAAADVTATIDVLGAYTARLRNNEGVTVSIKPRDKTRKHFKI